MTQRTFRRRQQGTLRQLNTQGESNRVGHTVLRVQFHFDDIFVFGEHALFNFGFTHLGGVYRNHLINQRHFKVQTRILSFQVFTQTQYNTTLLFIQGVEGVKSQHNNQNRRSNTKKTAGTTTAVTAVIVIAISLAEQTINLVHQLFQGIIQIRWLIAAIFITAVVVTPGIIGIALSAGLIPGHKSLQLGRQFDAHVRMTTHPEKYQNRLH